VTLDPRLERRERERQHFFLRARTGARGCLERCRRSYASGILLKRASSTPVSKEREVAIKELFSSCVPIVGRRFFGQKRDVRRLKFFTFCFAHSCKRHALCVLRTLRDGLFHCAQSSLRWRAFAALLQPQHKLRSSDIALRRLTRDSQNDQFLQ